jgi:hypothetical protein
MMRRARPIAAGGARRLCAADILTRRTVTAVNTIRERNRAKECPRLTEEMEEIQRNLLPTGKGLGKACRAKVREI